MDRKEFIKNEINQDPTDPFNHYLLAIEYQKEGAVEETFEQFENPQSKKDVIYKHPHIFKNNAFFVICCKRYG